MAPPNGADETWNWAQLTALAFKEAHRILGNRQDAEDAAQEAVLRAFRARAAEPDSPQAWVRTIARRESYRLISRRLLVTEADGEVWCPDSCERVPERLFAREAVRQVQRSDLPLLVRRYVLDQPASEIASEIGVPPATIRVRLHRAVKRLRERVDDPEIL